MEILESFFEIKDGSLWSYIEEKTYHMGLADKEYKELLEKIEDILNEHPNLREVLENEDFKELTKEDSEALSNLQTLYLDKRDRDMRNAFFLGGNNLYYYLKKLHLLDEEK